MAIYKNKDVTTNIETEKLSINNPETYFYTEDKGSAALRIFIKYRDGAFNLNDTNLTPTLDLFHSDGSIWLDEHLEVIMSDKGLLQYNIPNNVIEHAGKVQAKLFLRNAEQSVHVANFTFDIKDSGIEGAVEKEISVNIVDDAVRRIVKENATEIFGADFKDQVINSLIEYANTKPALFKSEVNVKDSGKIPLTLNKGITDNKQIYNDITHYRVIETGDVKQVIVYGNVKNLTGTSAYIADLPSNIAPTKTIRLPAGVDLTDREAVSAQVLLTGKVALVKQHVFKPEYPVEFYFSYYI